MIRSGFTCKEAVSFAFIRVIMTKEICVDVLDDNLLSKAVIIVPTGHLFQEDNASIKVFQVC